MLVTDISSETYISLPVNDGIKTESINQSIKAHL